MEDLNEKLIQSRNELQKQDYQLLDSRSAQAASNNDKNLARQRAAEDYNNAVSQTDQAVNHAYQEMVDAENALNNFLNQPETGESGEAVSYTHLDVYKRQECNTSSLGSMV